MGMQPRIYLEKITEDTSVRPVWLFCPNLCSFLEPSLSGVADTREHYNCWQGRPWNRGTGVKHFPLRNPFQSRKMTRKAQRDESIPKSEND
jgi:hypothetical protein